MKVMEPMKATPRYTSPAPRRVWSRLWILGMVLLAVSAIGSGVMLRSHGGSFLNDDQPVVTPQPIGPYVIAFGYVDSKDEIRALSPAQAGRVERVLVREGQEVDKGALLLEMDNYVATRDVQKARAAHEAAQDQVKQALEAKARYPLQLEEQAKAIEAAQHSLNAAKHEQSRAESLSREKLGSPEIASAALEKAQALDSGLASLQLKYRELKLHDPELDLARARREVEIKKALLEQAEFALKECQLTAPVKGTVLRVLANGGDLFGPQSKQPALFFCPSGTRIVRAEVEQEFAGRVAVGQPATIQDDTTTKTSWRGKVIRVSDWYTQRRSVLPEPVQLHDVRTLECIVELDADQTMPRINQRMRVSLGK